LLQTTNFQYSCCNIPLHKVNWALTRVDSQFHYQPNHWSLILSPRDCVFCLFLLPRFFPHRPPYRVFSWRSGTSKCPPLFPFFLCEAVPGYSFVFGFPIVFSLLGCGPSTKYNPFFVPELWCEYDLRRWFFSPGAQLYILLPFFVVFHFPLLLVVFLGPTPSIVHAPSRFHLVIYVFCPAFRDARPPPIPKPFYPHHISPFCREALKWSGVGGIPPLLCRFLPLPFSAEITPRTKNTAECRITTPPQCVSVF